MDTKYKTYSYLRVIVELQVWVVVLDAVIQDGHDDAFAGVAVFPRGFDVHVGSIDGAVIEEPLLGEQRVRRG